ncbi:MAG: amidase [Ponticaulis sp.]|nr:amidase [Ponticaulis sp.]
MSLKLCAKLSVASLLAITTACSREEQATSPELEVPTVQETTVANTVAAVSEDWLLKTLPELVIAIDEGDITSEGLTRAYLERIETLESEYDLNAVLITNPDAIAQARAIDEARLAGEHTGLLRGVPILLKDNIETSDNMPTTAGSLALLENFAETDAPLVSGIRASGGIILGKTNLSEWANFRANRSQSGWSGVGGRAKNPNVLDRQTCGSSAGSGAATAASLAAGSVGTETNGSIICPSNANGIVGFKPTLGVIPQEGIVPIAFSQDTAGPMTKSVLGAAILLTAMASSDTEADFISELSDTSLQGKRVGVLRFSVSDQTGIAELFDAALSELESAGAELVEIPEFDLGVEDYGEKSLTVLLVEFKETLNAYLAETPDTVASRTLADLIVFNEANSDAELPIFGQDLFVMAEETSGLEDEAYVSALAEIKKATGEMGIDRLLAEYEVDVLVSPSGPVMPVIVEDGPDNWPKWSGAGYLAAVAGYPHLSVPMGQVEGVPVGLSFMSTAGADTQVLSFGYAYEQASQMRVDPAFLPTSP